MKKLGFVLALAFCLATMATMAVGQDVGPGSGFNLDGQGTGIYSTRPTGADLSAGTTEVVLQVITRDSTGAAIDLDLDGNREIVVQTCGSNVGAATQTRLYIFEAEANNDFRQRSTVLIDAGTNSSGFGLFRGVDIGNIDGDAALEIVAASGTGTNSFMTIYDVNTSTFAMTELVQRSVFSAAAGPGLFQSSGTVSQIRILPNKNGGTNNDIIISNATGTAAGTHLFAVEYDGVSNIVFVNTTGANSGTVVNSGVISFNHGNFGDASDEEIVMVTENVAAPLAIREYATHATTPFGVAKTVTTNWTGTTTGSFTTVAVADLDGDGDLDAVASDYTGVVVRAIRRTGVDTYTSEAITAALSSNPAAVEISDFDNDGRREVVYSNGTSVEYQEHDGTADSFASGNFGPVDVLLHSLGTGTANAISFVGGSSTTLDNDLNFDFVVGRSAQVTDTDMDSDELFFLEADRSFAGGSIPGGSYDNLTITADTSLGGSITVRGTLGLSGLLSTGGNTLTIDCTGSITGVNPSIFVIGNLRKNYCATGVKGFEVGTLNGYSPVSVFVSAGTFPASLTVAAVQGPQPNVNPATSLQRYWTLTEGGDITANLNFNYLDPTDIAGVEANYRLIRVSGGVPVAFPLACPTPPANTACVDTGTNEAVITGVTNFSDWTLGEVASPTASDGVITGTITDSWGAPVAGTVVHLSGTQNRKFITNANGNYRFDNVETNGFYTVTPSRANYGFSPTSRSFSQLGNNTEAAFTAVPMGQTGNPLDTPEYFVRQHYLDFLGREPDEAGFNFWSNQILECGQDAGCIERRTINASAAHFLSIEFQRTGGLVDRLYRASYGRRPRYAEFMPDRAVIARDVVVGRSGWERQLAANEETFVDSFADRAAFHTAFDSLSNSEYVDALVSNTGVRFTPTERDSFVRGLNGGASRADVLQQIANHEGFAKARFNEAFVMMEYFGYLRRDPDEEGYRYWLNKLNQFDGNFERAEMVRAFIDSGEYRARFQR